MAQDRHTDGRSDGRSNARYDPRMDARSNTRPDYRPGARYDTRTGQPLDTRGGSRPARYDTRTGRPLDTRAGSRTGGRAPSRQGGTADRKKRERTLKRLGQTLFLPVSIIYMEMIMLANTCGVMGGKNVFYIILFSLSAGFLLSGLIDLFNGPAKTKVYAVVLFLVTFAFGTQLVYFDIFKTFMILSSILMAGDVVAGGFGDEALGGIFRCLPPIFMLLVPFVLFLLYKKDLAANHKHPLRFTLRGGFLALALYLFALICVGLDSSGITSNRSVYFDTFTPMLSMPRFGLMTTMRLDVKDTIATGKSTGKPGTRPGSPSIAASDLPKGPRKPALSNIPGLGDGDVIKVYQGPNVLEIDFDKLIAGESNGTIRGMHEYFSSLEPTMKNKYTGKFEGKNLIWIVGEAFSRYCLDEKYTPTLTKMANEGFVFENFYNPIWNVSTSDGEYTTLTSLIPKSGIRSFRKSANNYMAFSVAHMLKERGYTARAYHDHTYNYYNRDESHPNMGYIYKGLGNGLDVKKQWPESDVEMMEKTVPEYVGDDLFHVYYLSVSGHLEYNFVGNRMCIKHKADVQPLRDAGYSDAAAAYVACQMEFDQSIKYLIDELEKAGKLDDTVIVISGDHYPYGLELGQLAELNGGKAVDDTFEAHRSTLIIWNSEMAKEKPVKVSKYCCSLDVLPTVCNLFNLPFDSRLLMGRDIFSDAAPLVIFRDKSFITELGRYNAGSDTFTPNEGVTVPDGYAQEMAKVVRDRINYSAKILDNDYYSWVL